MKPVSVTCYQCDSCKAVYLSREIAESCCVCSSCGQFKGKSYCGPCADKHASEQVKKYIEAAVDRTESGEWGPMLYCEQNGRYYGQPDEVLGDFEEGFVPEWLFGTKEQRSELNLEAAIERMEDDTYEGAEVVSSPELNALTKAVDEFNAKHAILYCEPDYKVKVKTTKGGA